MVHDLIMILQSKREFTEWKYLISSIRGLARNAFKNMNYDNFISGNFTRGKQRHPLKKRKKTASNGTRAAYRLMSYELLVDREWKLVASFEILLKNFEEFSERKKLFRIL